MRNPAMVAVRPAPFAPCTIYTTTPPHHITSSTDAYSLIKTTADAKGQTFLGNIADNPFQSNSYHSLAVAAARHAMDTKAKEGTADGRT